MTHLTLPAQPPLFPPEAEDYSRLALARSRELTEGMAVIRNQAYGPDAQQTLDFYPPAHEVAGGAPILVFAHGGAWTNGYKEWLGLMAPAVTARGIAFVSFNYRLAPAFRYDAMVDDCLAALAWVRRHGASYGGNPGRLAVGGHSAGGHITMLTAWQPARLKAADIDPDSIQGCFPLCAPLDTRYPDAEPGSGEARAHEVLLDDPAQAADASPVCHLHAGVPPTLLAYASNDLPRILHGNRTAEARMTELGLHHERMEIPGDHFSVALALESPQAAWIQAVTTRIKAFT